MICNTTLKAAIALLLITAVMSPSLSAQVLPPAEFEYVVITPAEGYRHFQVFVDWKTRKGIPAVTVTTNWIYNNYTGHATEQEQIRAFVADAHATWGAEFFLLGGDTAFVPCHLQYFPLEYVATDTYYADYDGDFLCEVHVGRAPVRNLMELRTFMRKVVTYETNPPLDGYTLNAGLLGFDTMTGVSDGETWCEHLDTLYFTDDWNLTKVYDSDAPVPPRTHLDDVLDAIDMGQNLIAHADHGSPNWIGVGHVNHSLHLKQADVDLLTNGDRLSILYSISCDSAHFDNDDCIGEHFVRHPQGGCVAYIGHSRISVLGSDLNGGSWGFGKSFFNELLLNNQYKLGVCFSEHKNKINSGYEWKKHFEQLTLLGDPEMPVWTAIPSRFLVTLSPTLKVNAASYSVNVVRAGVGPVENAYVCLWKKEDGVYERGYTDKGGDLALSFTNPPASTGTLLVTVTKQNFLPFLGSAEVVP